METDELKFSMDATLEDGLWTPGKLDFNWQRLYDVYHPEWRDEGIHHRLEHLYYLYKYVTLLPDECSVVEIGTNKGESAAAIGMALQEKNGRLVTIDPGFLPDYEVSKPEYEGYEILSEFTIVDVMESLRRMGVDEHITIATDLSVNVLQSWTEPIDMLFVDGSHTYRDVLLDCGWMEHVKLGGIAVFDDWIEPVSRAVMEYVEDKPEWSKVTCSSDQPPGKPWKTVYIKRLVKQRDAS